MCGLVGVVNKRQNGFTKQQQDMFSHLLFVDLLRGADSTGVFTVTNDGDVFVAKDEGHSLRFLGTKEYGEAQQKAWNRGSALIGHNRKATRGSISDVNAHPFNVNNNIILVHNGTMDGNHRKHADVEVDSHAIAHLIQEKGDVGEALSAFTGAYALIWYNIEKGELNMIRNYERPLYWMETEDAWVWASEDSMLTFAATRTEAKIKEGPTMLPTETHQIYKLENRGWAVSDAKVEVKKPVVTYSGGSQYTSQGGDAVGGEWGEEYWGGLGHHVMRPPFRRHQESDILTAEEWERKRNEATWHQRRREEERTASNLNSGGAVQLLPRLQQQPRNLNRVVEESKSNRAHTLISRREPTEFAGCTEAERRLAKSLNKIISYGHYRDIIINSHPYNVAIHGSGFEYRYVNGANSTDGFYLYASPFDDEDIILRHYYAPGEAGITEERLIQFAGCDYVFEFLMQTRAWNALDPADLKNGRIDDKTPGYVIIRSSGIKLIASGLDRAERNHH